jgi:hypothetical protein
MLVKTSDFHVGWMDQQQSPVNKNWGSGTLMKGEDHLPLPEEFAYRV